MQSSIRGAPPTGLTMRKWLSKAATGGSRSEVSRPVSSTESALSKFDSATLDRISSVAVQAERIIESGSKKHLPVIRKNYRTQVRSLLAKAAQEAAAGKENTGVDQSRSSSSLHKRKESNPSTHLFLPKHAGGGSRHGGEGGGPGGSLELALHKATLAYYLSLHLHEHNYHHLALLSDYILLIEVCCRFPAGSRQHEDAEIFLVRCESIVSEETIARHPDQCKACAAQPIVAGLLEDWNRLESAQKLFAAHTHAATSIYGTLHPASGDAALQEAAFHARHNAHALCLRQCRVALSIVVLHAGLWNATAAQLNFHIGTHLRSMGLQSQAAFFFQRAADVFEYVATSALQPNSDRPAGGYSHSLSVGQPVDKSAAGSALLWFVLSSFQLHAVQREAENNYLALRHLREVRALPGRLAILVCVNLQSLVQSSDNRLLLCLMGLGIFRFVHTGAVCGNGQTCEPRPCQLGGSCPSAAA